MPYSSKQIESMDDVATRMQALVDGAFDALNTETPVDEAGFGFGGKASGFVRRGGAGFGGKSRRAAFFAKLKGGDITKVGLRYRKPSAKNLSGVTRIKKRGMKVTGAKLVTGTKRKPLQFKRKILRQGKYYSAASKISRYGNPKFLGI